MASRLILDKAGRVVLPKVAREALQLGPGDALELETAGDRVYTYTWLVAPNGVTRAGMR